MLDKYAVREFDAVWFTDASSSKASTTRYCIKFTHQKNVVRIGRVRFQALVGENIAKWCEERPGRKLDKVIARRWGLTEAAEVEKSDSSGGERWRVAAALYAAKDDPEKGWEAGCMYGMDESCNFFPLLLFTLDIVALEKLNMQVFAEFSDDHHQMIRPGKTRAQILDSIDDWCLAHPGRTRLLGGPGFRQASRSARDYYTNGYVFMYNPEFPCALGAIANGVYLKQGSDRARVVARTRPWPTVRNLKDLQKWAASAIGFVSLDKFREYDGTEKKHFDVHWVVNQMTGLALIRLRGSPGVDHLVCVD